MGRTASQAQQLSAAAMFASSGLWPQPPGASAHLWWAGVAGHLRQVIGDERKVGKNSFQSPSEGRLLSSFGSLEPLFQNFALGHAGHNRPDGLELQLDCCPRALLRLET